MGPVYNEQVAELYTEGRKSRQRWIDTVRAYLRKPPGRILDIGCGDGASSLGLADEADLIVGLDPSLAMLRLGKKRAEKNAVANAVFVLGELAHLPFSKNAFDGVISVNAVHYVPPRIALTGIRRVLRSGGRIVIRDITQRVDYGDTRIKYYLGLLRSFPMLVRERGLRSALRKIQLRIHPRWVKQVFSGLPLPAEEHRAQYSQYLPGCTFKENEKARSIIAMWAAPPDDVSAETR
jgi:ubiquinone/menaquinone biosynthesis C-methylase UbiE